MDIRDLLDGSDNNNVNRKYACSICDLRFLRKFDQKRHIESTHGNGMFCVLCRRELKSGTRRDMRVRHLSKACPIFKCLYGHDTSCAKRNAGRYFAPIV